MSLHSVAQTTFQKIFGSTKNENAFFVQQTSDKGFIISGIVSIDSANSDIYLVKTDSLGDTLWVKTYGGPKGEFQSVAQQTSDGGYIIGGSTYSYGAGQGDIFLLKTNSNGDTLWTKTYGGIDNEIFQYLQQTNDGGYIIGAHSETFGPRGDFYLIKTQPNGDTLWTRNYGGAQHDHGFCVQQTSDNGYIVAGHSVSFGISGGFYAVKTDSNGDTLWTRGYGGASDSYCYFVQQTSDGGYILTGSTNCFGAGNTDALVIKINSSGDTLWSKTYGGPSSDYFNCVKQTPDGGYIFVGTSSSFGADSTDIYLVKTNSAGDTLWSKIIGGIKDDVGMSVSLSADSGYILTGSTKSFGGGDVDVYLIKTDKYGNTNCNAKSVSTQITNPDSLMMNVPTSVGRPTTLVDHSHLTLNSTPTSAVDICSLIGVQLFSQETNSFIKVFPIPATEFLRIESEETIGLINLYDCIGKSVIQKASKQTTQQLDLSSLQSGIYILELAGKHFQIIKE